MMEFKVDSVATVQSPRTDPEEDDHWGSVVSTIAFHRHFAPEALQGLVSFSHAEVVFLMHLVPESEIVTSARHPRGQRNWPSVGIFAQRGKSRPNRIGVSRCRIIQVCDRILTVEGLDAIHGTPVLDVKPYIREFGPRGSVKQPQWATELMRDYY